MRFEPHAMARINLTNLETVCCIAKFGTFSNAALRLNASQPAITSRVRELEESLGFALFERHGRRMELTIEGRKFIQRVEPLMSQIDDAVLAFSDPAAASGIVRIGTGVLAMNWIPQALAGLQKIMPNVNYDIDIDMGGGILEKLQSGKLDIAILGIEFQSSELTTIPLNKAKLVWVMTPDIPREKDGRALSLGEIFDSAPVWVVSRSSSVFQHVIEIIRKHGAMTNNINTCPGTVWALGILERTSGIALVPASLAAERLASGTLVRLSDALPEESLHPTLAFHKDQNHSIIRYVVQHLVEADLRAANGDRP
jgi:DNA-binding transcriptional LysR family regulator